jgi:ketosteroid isomerase-like protein
MTNVMTPAAMDRLIDEHLAAEMAKDIPATLATLTPDAEHDVAGAPGVLRGPDQIAGFYGMLFGELTIKDVRTVRRLHGPDFAVDDAIATCTADGRPFGFDGRSRPFEFRILHVFEFEDGRIRRENAWLDMGAIAAQLGDPAA